MLRRYEDALSNRLDKVAEHGWAFIAWWEMYLWYNVDRLGKNVWRDIRDRFMEENKIKKGEYMFTKPTMESY